jgi:hypothetical protein
MRLIKVNKNDRVVILREVPKPKVERVNVFIERDNLCDECEFRYDCPVARMLRNINRCF